MENATKALFIASGVLMGVMILSLGVYLYNSLGSYVSETQEQMEITSNNQFNTQFLNYINMTQDSSGDIKINNIKYRMDFTITLQDVITVANLAYEINKELGLEDGEIADANENNLYVRVNAVIPDDDGTTDFINNIESMVNTTISSTNTTLYASQWLKNDITIGYQYKCISSDVKISSETGRVYEITFR